MKPIICIICKVKDLKTKIDEALRIAEESGNKEAAIIRKHI